MATLLESIKEKLGSVLVTAVVSLVTIFSDSIVGRIKSEVNKAEQRPAQQEKIAKDISSYIFSAENVVEFATKNLTTKDELEFVVKPYNDAIDTVRKAEYVYQAAIERYWNADALRLYYTFLADVKSMDVAVHTFNQENALVVSGTNKKWDDAKAKELAPPAAAALQKLQNSSKVLLSALSK